MPAKFCVECGEGLARRGWRALFRGNLCDDCVQRRGRLDAFRYLIALGAIAAAAFTFGRYLRPSPPPLIIQRAANSPLSDAPVNLNNELKQSPRTSGSTSNSTAAAADDTVYICGARTQKGTPCRRRVHNAGDRCFQHKGMAAMVPLEKLTIKP